MVTGTLCTGTGCSKSALGDCIREETCYSALPLPVNLRKRERGVDGECVCVGGGGGGGMWAYCV